MQVYVSFYFTVLTLYRKQSRAGTEPVPGIGPGPITAKKARSDIKNPKTNSVWSFYQMENIGIGFGEDIFGSGNVYNSKTHVCIVCCVWIELYLFYYTFILYILSAVLCTSCFSDAFWARFKEYCWKSVLKREKYPIRVTIVW